MPTISHFGESLFLVALTVAIHATGLLGIVWGLHRYRQIGERHFGHMHNTIVLTIVVVLLLGLHLLEVACWAIFYETRRCFPDLQTAIYFSLTTFSTVGYGDVVLNREWRLLGGLEALTGVLMVSWSTAVLLGLCSWIYSRRIDQWRGRYKEAGAPREAGKFPWRREG